MFANALPLNPNQHADLTLVETTDYRFVAGEMIVPIVYFEMADVAREYPLVFLRGHPLPVVLTGIEKGVNAYVAADGRWLAHYVPGMIRAYPFALAQVPGKSDEHAIAFDPNAPQLMQKDGHVLFTGQGVPSSVLQSRIDLLEQMKKAEPITVRMVQALRDSGLLVERTIRIKRPQGEDSQLTGMEVIDEKALNTLPLENFGALRDQGLLPLIYAHLLSMANLRQGVLAGKYPQLQKYQDDALKDLFKSEILTFN